MFSPADFGTQFFAIFYYVVLPILLLAGVGFFLKRVLELDLHSLKIINFYATLPTVVFLSIVTSTVTLSEIKLLAGSLTLLMLMQFCVALLYSAVMRVRGEYRPALLLSSTFGNLGNFGLPLQDLAFRSMGLSSQALGFHAYLLVTNNLLTFTGGVLIASGSRNIRKQLTHILRFPSLYALAAGLLVSILKNRLGWPLPGIGTPIRPLWDVLLQLKGAFIAIALITLGAQLASMKPVSRRYPIAAAVIMRMLLSPLIGFLVVLVFGLRGVMAQSFMIAAAAPTAVNAVLLTMEFDTEPEMASRIVFYTTLLAPVSVTVVLIIIRSGLFGVFAT